MKTIPDREITRRVRSLCELLKAKDVNFALIFQNTDRFYFTGTLQDGVLLVPTDGRSPVLFIKRTLERALEESPLENIIGFTDIREVYEYIWDQELDPATVGLEMDIIPAKFYLNLLRSFPQTRFVDISKEIRSIRAIKSEFEIDIMREGGRRLDNVLEKLLKELKPGRTEYDVYRKLTDLFYEQEALLHIRTRSFSMESLPIHILSGQNAAKHSAMDSPSGGGDGISIAFPAGPGFRKLQMGETVLIDVAFNYAGYNIDCARVFAFGKIDTIYERAHRVSDRCHELFLKKARMGSYIPDVYNEIVEYVSKEGLSDVFMGGVKFIGHGVGLELDEFPIITENFKEYIQKGMVIAFEPKFIFDHGSAGYENTYYIVNEQAETLSHFEQSIHFL